MNAQTIKTRFDFYVINHDGLFPPSARGRGVYVGILNRVCKGDANRKLFLKYMTGKTSTKVLSDNEWTALKKMCDISPVELERMVGIILGEIVKQDGQLTLAEAEKSESEFIMNEAKQ
jgi:hypothetical protein